MEKAAGDVVIRQADEGDNFYVVESGTCNCYMGSCDDSGLVNVCESGDCFGELALMYNAPRAATVMAATDVSLWALDRPSFTKLVMQAALDRRKQNEDFLQYVPVLATLSKYDHGMLADAVTPVTYEDGEPVLKQGDAAEDFFIVQEGEVVVSAVADGAETPAELARLGRGDYFGCVPNPSPLVGCA